MSSSDTSFTPPPGDGGQLKPKDVPDGSTEYKGLNRTYTVTPQGKYTTVSVKLAGVPLPESDKLDLDVYSARERFAKRVAGDMNPKLAVVIEEDLRQFAADAATNTAAASGNKKREQQSIARFDGLVDLVRCGRRVCFLVRESGTALHVQNTVSIDDITYTAPELQQLPFAVPQYQDVKKSLTKDPRELWEEVSQWIARSVVPPKGYRDLLVAWIFHTHIVEKFLHSPILALECDPEFGKTRLGKAMLYVARRGLFNEAPNAAQLLRQAHDLDCTLFIDVRDIVQTLKVKGIENLVLHRFERGTKTARVIDYQAGPLHDTKYYDVYGPTIIGTNTLIQEPLSSRCLPVQMRHAIPDDLPHPLEQDALPLRAKLIAWRANVLGADLPTVPVPFKGRLADLAKPLIQVTQMVAADRLPSVLQVFRDMDAQRVQRYSESDSGLTLRALIGLRSTVTDQHLSVESICDEANELAFSEKGVDDYMSRAGIGEVLRLMGLRTRSYGKTRRKHLVYDWDQICSLAITKLGRDVSQS